MARALPLQGRGRRFESVNAHHRMPLHRQGISLLLWEVDDPLLVRSRQEVGTRRFGGCIEGVGDVAVETFEEVTVDVEYGAYRRMAEAGCDHLWVGSLLDEESYMGVPHIMKTARLADGGLHRGFPIAGPEAAAT